MKVLLSSYNLGTPRNDLQRYWHDWLCKTRSSLDTDDKPRDHNLTIRVPAEDHSVAV